MSGGPLRSANLRTPLFNCSVDKSGHSELVFNQMVDHMENRSGV